MGLREYGFALNIGTIVIGGCSIEKQFLEPARIEAKKSTQNGYQQPPPAPGWEFCFGVIPDDERKKPEHLKINQNTPRMERAYALLRGVRNRALYAAFQVPGTPRHRDSRPIEHWGESKMPGINDATATGMILQLKTPPLSPDGGTKQDPVSDAIDGFRREMEDNHVPCSIANSASFRSDDDRTGQLVLEITCR